VRGIGRIRRTPGWVHRISRVSLLGLLVSWVPGGFLPAGADSDSWMDADGSSSVFFRDKFSCARWVEKRAPDGKCLECHGGILKEEDLTLSLPDRPGAPVLTIHVQHMRSGKVNFQCATCHLRIDPYQASSAGLRDQVPANMCFKCHFPHGP